MIPSDLLPVASHLWQSTVFAAAVWVLALAVKENRAALRYGLWFLASVKFLIPFSLLVNAGGELGRPLRPTVVQPEVAAVMTGISKSLLISAEISPMVSAGADHGGIRMVVLAIWLGGVAVGLIFWARLVWQIGSVRRAATPIDLDLPIPVLSSRARLEPGVVGIFRPVLILPAGIMDRLTPAQFQAVLAHELCHVRRRDNLSAAVHMVVEIIFWFHPLVWWIRRQLIVERERACDERVVEDLNDVQAYAEGILTVCRFYVESRLECASGITGGDLKQRVQRIVAQTTVRGLGWSKKTLLAVACLISVTGPLTVGLLNAPRSRAQSQSQKQPALSFEVASIKRNRSDTQDMSLNRTPGGGLEMINGTTRTLVQFAYGVSDYQLSGVPAWFDTEHYDVIAKAPAGTKMPNPDQLWLDPPDDPLHGRLQSLLAERFHLAVHHETKEMAVLALVQEKGGAKLELWKEGDQPGPHMHGTYTSLTCRKFTMQRFANGILSERFGTAVIDKTGLTGEYNFVMNFQPDRPAAPGGAPDPSGGPTFLQALHDQLGLRLERQKGKVDILVIDQATKPEAN